MVDLRPCKAHALQVLPPDHPFRIAILQEPDFLPADRADGKLETYIRLAMGLRNLGKTV